MVSSIPCGSPVFLYGSDLLSLLKSSVSHVMVVPAAQFEVFSLFDDAECALLLVLKGMNLRVGNSKVPRVDVKNQYKWESTRNKT
ncbi:hypothetical protein FF2_028542 [Malus domestica]